MRAAWVAIGLLIGSVAATQDAPRLGSTELTFQSVSERLASVDTLRGDFVQTREIAALSRPLRSSGRFIVSELGLYWDQLEPFQILLIAGEDGMTQRVADQAPVTVAPSEQPIALSISQVFLGIFRGDLIQVDEYFDVSFDAMAQSWTMQLEPKEYPLTEAVERISVEGSEYIDRLIVLGAAGDTLTVDFSAQQSEPPTLSDAERELYVP